MKHATLASDNAIRNRLTTPVETNGEGLVERFEANIVRETVVDASVEVTYRATGETNLTGSRQPMDIIVLFVNDSPAEHYRNSAFVIAAKKKANSSASPNRQPERYRVGIV
jgi:hypothetical protein